MAVMGQVNQINFDYAVLVLAQWDDASFHPAGAGKRQDYEMALEALDKVGGYRDRNFQSLSGGEKQRVVLARALPEAARPRGACTSPSRSSCSWKIQ